MEKLALHGGEPIRRKPFPRVSDISGRDLGDEEIKLLIEVIKSGKLNRNNGAKVRLFEEKFAEKMGTKFAIASTSGTAALHIAVATVNPDPGDEIITSPITDMGTIIGILFQNAIPVFADVDSLTGNLDPESARKKISKKTKAIIAVHLFGQLCDMDSLLDIARDHQISLIEDCAQAHLAEYKGRKVGIIGDIGCFSLQQSKQITTGDGGITITNDEKLAQRAALFADKCYPRRSGEEGIPFLGMNYRMTELQGAVALAQLEKIENILSRRRKSADLLSKLLKEVEGVNLPPRIKDTTHSYWMYSFTINEKTLGTSTAEFVKALNAEGLPFVVGYGGGPLLRDLSRAPLIFEHDVLDKRKTYGSSHCPYDCPRASRIEYRKEEYPNALLFQQRVCTMSWNEGITEEDVYDIARGIKKVARLRR